MTARDSVETLATGYGLVEGLRVDAHGQPYFSDVVRGGAHLRPAHLLSVTSGSSRKTTRCA